MADKPKQKFFLALDQKSPPDVERAVRSALDTLYGNPGTKALWEGCAWNYNSPMVGIKVNLDQVHGPVQELLRLFSLCFVDEKLAHGSGTAERTLRRLKRPDMLPNAGYYTVSAGIGRKILKEYVETGRQLGMETIAFTAHTNMPPEDVKEVYGTNNVEEAIAHLGGIAADSGCHAIVLEADMLQNPEIRNLPLKKLVTGIRIDPQDKGQQSRVTSLDSLLRNMEHIDYIVVSSRYLENPEALRYYFSKILGHEPGSAPVAPPALLRP
jgi:orotidine-5'-phosphate decarboxylase